MNRSKLVIAIILGVLVLDQAVKFWIKLHFCLNEAHPILGELGFLRFTENRGMAFGLELGGGYGKLLLSVFRIVAVSFIGYFLSQMLRDRTMKTALCVCVGLIFAGALGNILDSVFYGMIFSESGNFYHPGDCSPATLFPPGGGYAGFLHGSVVDMLHFPIIQGVFPEWLPIWGGEPFEFFRPIFNIADASISIGVITIILFHRSFFTPEQIAASTGFSVPLQPNTTHDTPQTSDSNSSTLGIGNLHNESGVQHTPNTENIQYFDNAAEDSIQPIDSNTDTLSTDIPDSSDSNSGSSDNSSSSDSGSGSDGGGGGSSD